MKELAIRKAFTTRCIRAGIHNIGCRLLSSRTAMTSGFQGQREVAGLGESSFVSSIAAGLDGDSHELTQLGKDTSQELEAEDRDLGDIEAHEYRACVVRA